MKKILLILFVVFLVSPVRAGEILLVASAAGYKVVIETLLDAYTQKTGSTVERIFGNMGQVIGQAQTSGKVDLVVGEESFLRKSSLPLGPSTTLGTGRLVLAWPQGKGEPEDFKSLAITRIALPDPAKAIYGQAAMEYLSASGLYQGLKDKLVMVATVPQVLTYLITGEVDAGFINLTQARAVTGSLGGYREIDPDLYNPIVLSCIPLTTSPSPETAQEFLKFLTTSEAQAIINTHGL
ncbi:MAG: molybdate ABC transporter substrate-binding protein [Desulfomicrobium sp.]|jgi:molybdate transport system substrate-binding protein|nr:molybdate ABC transporter substrate-binding protein [Desulfomicrobium sp.]